MANFAPAAQVEAPARQPLPFGLMSVLAPRSAADDRWQAGITWEALGCDPVSGIGQVACEPDENGRTTATGLPKNLDGHPAEDPEYDAFTVYGTYVCSPVGNSLEYAQRRAEEHLLSGEEARVEQALWTGDLDNTGFATGAEDAGPGSLVRSVAALEQWLAENYRAKGVIHMTREAALLGVVKGVLEVKGNTLVTRLGTPVVAGSGYPGTGPTGQAPAAGSTYVYATPAIVGYRSAVFPGADNEGGFDRAVNNVTAVAERTYVVGWDNCGTAYSLAALPEG
jgi:hypothetical protein